jgi:hypothetical protein
MAFLEWGKRCPSLSAMNSFTSMGHSFQLVCMYVRLGLIEVTAIIAIILWTQTCSSRACDPNKGPMKPPCMHCIACQSVHVKRLENPCISNPSVIPQLSEQPSMCQRPLPMFETVRYVPLALQLVQCQSVLSRSVRHALSVH